MLSLKTSKDLIISIESLFANILSGLVTFLPRDRLSQCLKPAYVGSASSSSAYLVPTSIQLRQWTLLLSCLCLHTKNCLITKCCCICEGSVQCSLISHVFDDFFVPFVFVVETRDLHEEFCVAMPNKNGPSHTSGSLIKLTRQFSFHSSCQDAQIAFGQDRDASLSAHPRSFCNDFSFSFLLQLITRLSPHNTQFGAACCSVCCRLG